MRVHDWTGFAALGAGILGLIELTRGMPETALVWLLASAAAAVVTRYFSVRHPAPMPHLLRWTLRVPRGNHSPERLRRILDPQSGERMLEIGPGVGVHALPMARALAPDGTLDVLDVQQAMLDDVMQQAARAGITSIAPRQGEAHRLPYRDATFDGAYLIGVLGEIPDGPTALREIRRVLKPGGRLVIGEVAFDPDFVSLGSLKRRTAQAGFVFEQRTGHGLSYLARFRPAGAPRPEGAAG